MVDAAENEDGSSDGEDWQQVDIVNTLLVPWVDMMNHSSEAGEQRDRNWLHFVSASLCVADPQSKQLPDNHLTARVGAPAKQI